jgi:hypothetical protein
LNCDAFGALSPLPKRQKTCPDSQFRQRVLRTKSQRSAGTKENTSEGESLLA